RPRPDQCHALAVLGRGRFRQSAANVVFVVGGDALQAADRDRLLLDPAAPARRLAWPVAGAPEDPRKNVRVPIDHVGIRIASGGNEPNVFGYGCVSRTSPLAVDDLMKIVR